MLTQCLALGPKKLELGQVMWTSWPHAWRKRHVFFFRSAVCWATVMYCTWFFKSKDFQSLDFKTFGKQKPWFLLALFFGWLFFCKFACSRIQADVESKNLKGRTAADSEKPLKPLGSVRWLPTFADINGVWKASFSHSTFRWLCFKSSYTFNMFLYNIPLTC